MDKRTVLAMTLCFAFVALWYFVVVPQVAPPRKPPEPAVEPEARPPEGTPPDTPIAPAAGAVGAPVEAAEPREEILIETGRFLAVLTNRGAGLRSLAVKFGRDPEPVVLLPDVGRAHFALSEPAGRSPLDTECWQVVEEGPLAVRFAYRTAEAEILKTFQFSEGAYHFDLELEWRLAEGTEGARSFAHALDFGGIEHDSAYRYDQYDSGVVASGPGRVNLQSIPLKKGEDDGWEESSVDFLQWVALKNRYFAVALWPLGSQPWIGKVRMETKPQPSRWGEGKDLRSLRVRLEGVDLRVDPDHPWASAKFQVLAGPIERSVLAAYKDRGLTELESYGWFGFIAKFLLAVLNFFFRIVGNYGWAIVLTTVALRLCLFPLNWKSQSSMIRMQRIQPQLKALQERYKDDRMKLSQEMRKLMKEEGVNPAGGCLPLLIQFPIFIAFYWVLATGLDLRRAPFILWVKDLSQPDRLLSLAEPIGVWKFSLDALNLLPLLMIGMMVLQMATAPKAQDPQMRAQQKMMLYIMPAFFLFICYGFASGLSLYWFTSSLVGFFEQRLIRKLVRV